MIDNIFHQSRILVTGGAGFLGTEVVQELERRGAKNIYVPRSREYDLTDARQTEQLFIKTQPNLVLHLAARVGGIEANRQQPGTFFRDNLLMGLHVLDIARQYQVAKVVIVGTICAYPKFTTLPFQEENLWNGYPEETNAPYGIAKKSLLVMAQAYRQEFGCNFVMIFPVNLYGPGDNFDLQTSHVIPAMIRKFVTAKNNRQSTVELWGDGSPTREFLYVKDAARGLVNAAEYYNQDLPINLGSGVEISIKDLAYKIARMTNYTGSIVWNTAQPNGQPRRLLDVSKAKEYLKFEASTSLEEGLAETIDWYCQNI